jgi:FMN phosphatase YigB (HAD superfamily)
MTGVQSRDRHTVLFDVGNVLASDFWETLLLTPVTGLADQLHIDRELALTTGRRLWRYFAVRQADEAAYWEHLGRALGRRFDPHEVRSAERRLIRPNTGVAPLVRALKARSVAVGVISNNTSFWYPKQTAIAGLSDLLDPPLVFLSCDYGAMKNGAVLNLFDVAARHTDPPRTLVVDDRDHNVNAAQARGFEAVRYDMNQPEWPTAVKDLVA